MFSFTLFQCIEAMVAGVLRKILRSSVPNCNDTLPAVRPRTADNTCLDIFKCMLGIFFPVLQRVAKYFA